MGFLSSARWESWYDGFILIPTLFRMVEVDDDFIFMQQSRRRRRNEELDWNFFEFLTKFFISENTCLCLIINTVWNPTEVCSSRTSTFFLCCLTIISCNPANFRRGFFFFLFLEQKSDIPANHCQLPYQYATGFPKELATPSLFEHRIANIS